MKKEIQVVKDWLEETRVILNQDKNEEFDFATVESLFKDSKKFRIQSEEVCLGNIWNSTTIRVSSLDNRVYLSNKSF